MPSVDTKCNVEQFASVAVSADKAMASTLDPEVAAVSHHSGRIPQLDGLRALAMFSVFLYAALDAPLLWMGVDVFFVLSGFLITGILLQRKKSGTSYFGYFYSRRARRILAPYWLLMIVSSLLFGAAWLKQWYWYVFFLTNIPVAFNHVSHSSLGVLWSLAVEEQFYLIWPVIILFIPEVLLSRVAWALLLLAPVLRAVATPFLGSYLPIYHLTPFRMDLLAAGALLAIAWRKDPNAVKKYSSVGKLMVIVSLIVLFSLSVFPWFRTSQHTVLTNTFVFVLTLLVAVGVLMWALKDRTVFSSFLSLPFLRYVGRISYSMYLIHATAIILAEKWFQSPLIVLCVSFAGAFLYSAASWHLLEKRLAGSRHSKPRREQSSETCIQMLPGP